MDNRHFIIRVVNADSTHDLSFFKDKLRRECDVMKWISSSTKIPIPRIHYYTVDQSTLYMITDKCHGKILADAFGLLPFEAKVYFSVLAFPRDH